MFGRRSASRWSGPLPLADPPPDLALFQLPTGTYETRAAFAVRGGRFSDRRRFAATAVLVQHPAGDLLIDAGFGAHVDRHVRMLARMERPRYERSETLKVQLDDVGYDFSRLRGV